MLAVLRNRIDYFETEFNTFVVYDVFKNFGGITKK